MNSVDCELSDRRRESRAATGGEVLLTIEGARKVEVRARIMDQSPSGFRVEHDCADLSSGAEVTFHYHSVSGRARVIWTLILGPVKQSGFLVLSR